MNKEAIDSLIETAMDAVHFHARQEHHLPVTRDMISEVTTRSGNLSLLRQSNPNQQHRLAMDSIPDALREVLEANTDTLQKQDPDAVRAGLKKYATQLYDKTIRHSKNSLKKPGEILLECIEKVKEPQPSPAGMPKFLKNLFGRKTETPTPGPNVVEFRSR